MNTVKKSRASFTGAITKALDKLKAIKADLPPDILRVNTKEIDRILSSVGRTQTGFLQTLEDAQEFVPEDDTAQAFQQEEDDAMDTFNSSISAVRDLADELLTIKSVLTGPGDLTPGMTALTDSLAEKPESNQANALQALDITFSSLRQEWKKANLPKDHSGKLELDACWKRLTDLGADVTSAKDKSAPHLTPTSSITSSDRPCCGTSKSDLPTIDVPTFNGDIMEWNSFWAAFSSTVGDREDLSLTKKLIYLRKAIKDPDSQMLLHSASETPEMYLDVVKELQIRFNRTREIHRNLTQSLLQLPTAKQTKVDLRSLVDTVKRTIDSIKATGHYSIETFLTSLVYLSLPSRLQTQWEQNSKKEKGVPPVDQILNFIREHAETLPSTQPSPGKATDPEKKSPRRSDRRQEHHPQRLKANVHVVAPASNYKWECPLCKPDKHPLYLCPKWLGYTVAQRLSHVTSKNLCSNCLAVGHATDVCKSTYRCRDCGQKHHTTIHQDTTPSTTIHSTTVQSHQVPDALMMTARVLLVGPGGHELKARALIDPGAGLSLVSRRVTQLLELHLEPNRMQFSAVQGTPCKPSKYRTNLIISPLPNKDKQIQCRAAVVQMVTCDIPSQPITPVTDLPNLMGLELADTTYDIPGRIDILLGAELYPQFTVKRLMVTGSITQPMAQPTIFGWAILGQVECRDPSIRAVPTYHTQS